MKRLLLLYYFPDLHEFIDTDILSCWCSGEALPAELTLPRNRSSRKFHFEPVSYWGYWINIHLL